MTALLWLNRNPHDTGGNPMNGGDDVKHLFYLDYDDDPIELSTETAYDVVETWCQVISNGPWKVTEFRHLVTEV